MDQDAELLAEMLLHSAQFCSKAEALSASLSEKQELDEFRLKLGQARNILERLQVAYSDDALDLGNNQAIGEFRLIEWIPGGGPVWNQPRKSLVDFSVAAQKP